MNDSLKANDDVIGDVPKPTNVSDYPPPKVMSVENVSTLEKDDEVLEEILFEDECTTAGVLPIQTSLTIFHKPSSSKAHFHFGLTSSSEASDENFEPKHNDVVPPPLETAPKDHQSCPSQ